MTIRFAFAGFRHGHIQALYELAGRREDCRIVAAGEEDAATREKLKTDGSIHITHESLSRMLAEVECDVVAVGDYYGRRGAILIEALQRGRHVISDKPICTSLRELEQIASLSRDRQRAVGCQLDLRDRGTYRRARELIRDGTLGEVTAVTFDGQHPLMPGVRPGWYFEAGKHGGTINDIAIHGFDAVAWMTGRRFAVVNAARNWGTGTRTSRDFPDGAQAMLTLDNGAGVLAEVSYFAPASMGYALPSYWQFRIWGSRGMLECDLRGHVTLYMEGEREPRAVEPLPDRPGGYLEAFLAEVRGELAELSPSTAQVLESSRVTLKTQEAADRSLTNVPL